MESRSHEIKIIIECLLMSSENPLPENELLRILKESLSGEWITKEDIYQAIHELQEDYKDRSIELCKIASGFRFQVRRQYAHWPLKLAPEKNERYSQAALETLALIAYRQPITRSEIEQIRGVSVSSQIIKVLLEREWVRILGYKQVPGRPALYGTTLKFLNDFNLSSLNQLPTLDNLEPVEMITQGEFDFELPK